MYENYLKKAPSKTGTGVFTTAVIPPNVPICEFKGEYFTSKSLKHSDDMVVQIGPDLFLGPSGDIDDFINHSCNPNCMLHIVGARAILYGLYYIGIGDELTFDYSTTSTDTLDDWQMKCECKQSYCRGIISGFHTLDEISKKDLKDRGLVPLYITNEMFGK